jgi:hypothetical protein
MGARESGAPAFAHCPQTDMENLSLDSACIKVHESDLRCPQKLISLRKACRPLDKPAVSRYTTTSQRNDGKE